jgi:type IV secretion system protein VirB10
MSKENNVVESETPQVDLPEVEQELSQVASNPKQSLLILVGVAGVFLYLFFNLFVNSGEPSKPVDAPVPENVVKPIQVSSDNAVPAIPNLPSPPKLETPTTPPPPPPLASSDVVAPSPLSKQEAVLPPTDNAKDLNPVVSNPTLPFDTRSQSDDAKKKLEQKRKSTIVLVAGTPRPKSPEQIEQETDFKIRGDMHLVLGRGKMLDAIIESAINTDFGGEIRAIISRDVYSEWGRNVLIPKGSRVFGVYNTGINGAYGRIAIEWTRIDLSSGYTINFGGTGMDALGRKGQQGRVDNKFKERFGNAILRSAFNITLASTLDTIVKPVTSTESASNQSAAASAAANSANTIFAQTGVAPAAKFAQICATVPTAITDKTSTLFTTINTACTTAQGAATDDQRLASLMSTITTASTTSAQTSTASTTPSQAQTASTQAFKDISDVAKEMLTKQKFDPTITIDQGSPIKIYVNKDYKFPKEVMKKVMK